MSIGYRVAFESYELNDGFNIVDRKVIGNGLFDRTTNCLDFSLDQNSQILLLEQLVDSIISSQIKIVD